MCLLKLEDGGRISLTELVGDNIPRYAIQSHIWGADYEELTYFATILVGRALAHTCYPLYPCSQKAETASQGTAGWQGFSHHCG